MKKFDIDTTTWEHDACDERGQLWRSLIHKGIDIVFQKWKETRHMKSETRRKRYEVAAGIVGPSEVGITNLEMEEVGFEEGVGGKSDNQIELDQDRAEINKGTEEAENPYISLVRISEESMITEGNGGNMCRRP